MATKPGWKTSEAHLTLLTIVGSYVMSRLGLSAEHQDNVLTKIGPFITAGLASASYAISRAISKFKG